MATRGSNMDKPILFQDEMVRAILRGSKTQTRRLVRHKDKPLPPGEIRRGGPPGYEFTFWPEPPAPSIQAPLDNELKVSLVHLRSPWGQRGSRIWVRESWAHDPFNTGRVVHRASALNPHYYRWKPNIHMKKIHCRIWLNVISVTPQRLNDISTDDARAEGFPYAGVWNEDEIMEWFINLWEQINGSKEGCRWEDNPWVWKIKFEMVDPGRKDYPGTQYARIVG